MGAGHFWVIRMTHGTVAGSGNRLLFLSTTQKYLWRCVGQVLRWARAPGARLAASMPEGRRERAAELARSARKSGCRF